MAEAEAKGHGRERQPSSRHAEGQKATQRAETGSPAKDMLKSMRQSKGQEQADKQRQTEGHKAKQKARGRGILEATRGGGPAHHKALLHFVKGLVIHAHVSRASCHHLHNKTVLMHQQSLLSACGLLHRHWFAISRVMSTVMCR